MKELGTLPPLVSPEQFAANVNHKVSANDPRLFDLLTGASTGIRRLCGWHITPVIEETLVLDGAGGRVLNLPTLRLVEVLEVQENGQPIPLSEFEISSLGQLRHRGNRHWCDTWSGINIRFKHGYDTAPDVASVVQQIVGNAIASPMGVTREQAGAISISWATTAPGVSGGISLLERDLALLASYRLEKRP